MCSSHGRWWKGVVSRRSPRPCTKRTTSLGFGGAKTQTLLAPLPYACTVKGGGADAAAWCDAPHPATRSGRASSSLRMLVGTSGTRGCCWRPVKRLASPVRRRASPVRPVATPEGERNAQGTRPGVAADGGERRARRDRAPRADRAGGEAGDRRLRLKRRVRAGAGEGAGHAERQRHERDAAGARAGDRERQRDEQHRARERDRECREPAL